MRRAVFAVAFLAALFVVASLFATREPPVEGPGRFDLFAFFEGAATSEGSVRTFLIQREAFTARFTGTWEGETFRLEERFRFPDGERLQIWRLGEAPGGYRGTVETQRADGSLGAAVPVVGIVDAGGIALDYHGIAPGGGRTLHFRHHMRMRDDGRVRNHVVVSLHGFPVATSTVTFTGGALSSPSGER